MFVPHKNADGAVAPFEYLPAAAITPKAGMALKQNDAGNLAICGATDTPTYIGMQECDAAVQAGTIIPVIRVDHDTIYKTKLQAAGTSLKLGNKVTLHTDGLQVTATTSSGVAEIIGMDGTAVGDTVYVRF